MNSFRAYLRQRHFLLGLTVLCWTLTSITCDLYTDPSDDETPIDSCSNPLIENSQVAIRVWNSSNFQTDHLVMSFTKTGPCSERQSHTFGVVESGDTTCYVVMNLQYDSCGVIADYDRLLLTDITPRHSGFAYLPLDFPSGYYTYIHSIRDSIYNYASPGFKNDSLSGINDYKSVNIRVFNESEFNYDSLRVLFPDTTVVFGALDTSSYSAYVKVPRAYSHATTYIYWTDRIAEYQVMDHMGEDTLSTGYYTFSYDLFEQVGYLDSGYLIEEVVNE